MNIKELNTIIDEAIKKINSLDPFDELEQIEKIEDELVNTLYTQLNNKTIKAINKLNNKYYYIVHKSTKKESVIQVSFFKKLIAISDKEYNNYKEVIKDLYTNTYIEEVI